MKVLLRFRDHYNKGSQEVSSKCFRRLDFIVHRDQMGSQSGGKYFVKLGRLAILALMLTHFKGFDSCSNFRYSDITI